LNLPERYLDFIKSNKLFNQHVHLLIAVSGGIDSVSLCHLCTDNGFRFSIAHCNFQLRGDESTRDENFVRELARQLNVPFYLERFNTKEYAKENKLSIQEAARELRYNWFDKIVKGDVTAIESGAGDKPLWIATAHNLDDNIETVLMNFCKGTGIKGLKGMDVKRGKLIRPMLFASRNQISSYVSAKHIEWVEDSSNAEEKYTRNYFRRQVIPVIENVYPNFRQQVAENISRFKEAGEMYDQSKEWHRQNLVQIKGEEMHIPILKLLKSVPLNTVVYEIIKEFGFSHGQVEEVIKLSAAKNGSYTSSSTHRIIRNRKWLIVAPLKPVSEPGLFVVEKAGDSIHTKDLKLSVKEADQASVKFDSECTVFIDADELQFPLVFRRWKEGDYFYPLGMKKKKKLSRFFIDQKLSAIEKENVWVIESAKKIVWLAGYRVDDRFKIKPSTKKIISFSISSLSSAGKGLRHQ
jgi:tRNA(Ile)-lysidine synthase